MTPKAKPIIRPGVFREISGIITPPPKKTNKSNFTMNKRGETKPEEMELQVLAILIEI